MPHPVGRVLTLIHESKILKDNPPGDPFKRKLVVYLPPSYDQNSDQKYPVIYLLSSFMGFGTMFLSPQAWGLTMDERCDKLISDGSMKDCIVVMPDCFTKFGGSQYINSPALGRYEDYLIQEIVPYIDATYRTKADAGHRALLGKSSGGYGALCLAAKYPEIFSAFYCSAGDMYFEYGYKPDIPKCYNAVHQAGGLEKFLAKFFETPKKSGEMITAINIIAMSAAYSPNAIGEFDLPFDLETGQLRDDVWNRWLQFDPIENLKNAGFVNGLKKLRHRFLECGSRDEYFLHIGARIFTKKLREIGVSFSYEEFDDGHMGTSYRYDVALKKLSEVIS